MKGFHQPTVNFVLVILCCVAFWACSLPIMPTASTSIDPKTLSFYHPKEKRPLRVGFAVSQDLVEYTGKYEIGALVNPGDLIIRSLPNCYLHLLFAHFDEVEIIRPGQDIQDEMFDLVTKMVISKWYYESPGMGEPHTVDLDILFSLETIHGKKLITKRIYGPISVPREQIDENKLPMECLPEIFARALEQVFTEFSKELEKSEEIRNFQRE